MELTLEQEFKAREFMHKVAIVGGAFMSNYLNEEREKGGAMLPDIILQQQAQEYSDKMLKEIMALGKLDNIYNDLWETLKDILPDDTIVTQEII